MLPVSCFCVPRHLLVLVGEVRLLRILPGEAGEAGQAGRARVRPARAAVRPPGKRRAGEAPHQPVRRVRTHDRAGQAELNCGPFRRIYVRIVAGKPPEFFSNSRRKLVDGHGKAR